MGVFEDLAQLAVAACAESMQVKVFTEVGEDGEWGSWDGLDLNE